MDSGATDHEVLEKKLEKNLQDPTAIPMSLPLEFLKVITCNFSTERELGRGAYGVVYKGVLQSGSVVAVKKIFDAHLLDLDNNNNNKRFENEIICLMGVRHQNVVQLVGYCVQVRSEVMKLQSGEHVMVQAPACLLCFEFLCKGSLDKHVSVLDWDKRYEIIRGVCSGLHYLHDECRIVHLDLKPQNILMDAAMMPKIADFGLSRLLGEQKSKTVTEKLPGTLEYMAKEYIDHGIISSKADIFSLGVIIVEIITGHRDYPNIGETTETSLKHYTNEIVGSWKNRLLETTPMHMSLEMHAQQVKQCISIALKCLEPESNRRPTSLDIVQSLNAVEPKCTSPGKPPNVAEKDRRNGNLESQASTEDMINVTKTHSPINSLNECANLFQWVISALKWQWSGTKLEKLQGDVLKLQNDHQYLSDSLPRIYDLIDRAEWRTHAKYVVDLLAKLKDAVYDAEDLLDEFRWYETKVSVEGNVSVEPIIDFFCSDTQDGFKKVISIQKRLDHLSTELEKALGSSQPTPRFPKSLRPETTSLPTEAEIFGRNEEKDYLIRLLGVPTKYSTDPSRSKRKISRKFVHDEEKNELIRLTGSGVQVLAIVGIGGVGKTTLAQDIWKHSKSHFDLRIWICVSDDFDVKRLTKEALEQSSREVVKTDNLNLLQGALANSLNNRRFLLVLDDMWNENELDWKRFYAPFINVLQGSMMLVTTRSQNVADVVRAMNPFPLEGLNEDVYWEFFKLCVFGSKSSNIDHELEMIGKKILPKLKGSPLAAKTLGRLLGMSLNPLHWEGILNSELWKLEQKETDILPALQLSYMYLPLDLKRCFSFCAVYPKDYIFTKGDLAKIWVAQGLVEHQDTGDQYFDELAHLSFFQNSPRSPEKYVIHDLIHDMAQLVSKDECFIVKDTKDLLNIPQNVRHLSVFIGRDVNCSELLNIWKHKKLRTLICDLSLESETDNTLIEKWCAELIRMRVMICSTISKSGLPCSISKLKHLRYLTILDSCACKSLPAEFCRLYNMQLFYAKKWEIHDIPSSFGMLINLQEFESATCKIRHIPLCGVRGGATVERPEREIVFWSYNGKSLPSCYCPQNLANVTSLGVHHWGNVKNTPFHSNNSTDSTFLSLAKVQIEGCQNLSSVEQFLQPAYVPNMKEIKIISCSNLERVPTEKFGDLRFLELLLVCGCPKIKSRGLFSPSLKELHLSNSGDIIDNIECSSLTKFCMTLQPTESIELKMWNLPSLQEFEIRSCESLRIIRNLEPLSTNLFHSGTKSRMGKFPLLTHVTISICELLKSMDDLLCLPAIESIEISYCGLQSLCLPDNRFGGSSHLKKLWIWDCSSLDGQSALLLPSSLQMLDLRRCSDFSGSFSSCLEKLTSLKELQICDCECIVSVPGHLWRSNLRSLQRLKFHDCPKLKSIGGLDAIAHIKDLSIENCPELKEIDQPLSKGNMFH